MPPALPGVVGANDIHEARVPQKEKYLVRYKVPLCDHLSWLGRILFVALTKRLGSDVYCGLPHC